MSGLNQHLHRLDFVLRYAADMAQDPRIDGKRRYEMDAITGTPVITWPEVGVRVGILPAMQDRAIVDQICKAFTAHDKALADAKLARNPLRRLQPRVRRVA